MNVDEIKRIAIVGSGTMGNGIAQVCASNGYDVDMIDVKQEFLDRAIKTIGNQNNNQKLRPADKKGKDYRR